MGRHWIHKNWSLHHHTSHITLVHPSSEAAKILGTTLDGHRAPGTPAPCAKLPAAGVWHLSSARLGVRALEIATLMDRCDKIAQLRLD